MIDYGDTVSNSRYQFNISVFFSKKKSSDCNSAYTTGSNIKLIDNLYHIYFKKHNICVKSRNIII